jgi:hypothetical protein
LNVIAGTVIVIRWGERNVFSPSVSLLSPDEAVMRLSPKEHFHITPENQKAISIYAYQPGYSESKISAPCAAARIALQI